MRGRKPAAGLHLRNLLPIKMGTGKSRHRSILLKKAMYIELCLHVQHPVQHPGSRLLREVLLKSLHPGMLRPKSPGLRDRHQGKRQQKGNGHQTGTGMRQGSRGGRPRKKVALHRKNGVMGIYRRIKSGSKKSMRSERDMKTCFLQIRIINHPKRKEQTLGPEMRLIRTIDGLAR